MYSKSVFKHSDIDTVNNLLSCIWRYWERGWLRPSILSTASWYDNTLFATVMSKTVYNTILDSHVSYLAQYMKLTIIIIIKKSRLMGKPQCSVQFLYQDRTWINEEFWKVSTLVYLFWNQNKLLKQEHMCTFCTTLAKIQTERPSQINVFTTRKSWLNPKNVCTYMTSCR